MLLRPLAAQQPPEVGSRIRVSLAQPRSHRLVGILLESRSDSLRVERSSDDVRAISRSAIERLEVSRGRHSRKVLGALIGLVPGLAGGLLAGTTAHRESQFIKVDDAGVVLITAMGGALGASLGSLIGRLFHVDRWETVPAAAWQPEGRLPVRRTPMTVGFSVSF